MNNLTQLNPTQKYSHMLINTGYIDLDSGLQFYPDFPLAANERVVKYREIINHYRSFRGKYNHPSYATLFSNFWNESQDTILYVLERT